MEEPIGLVIVLFRATMLLRGLRDLEELSGPAVNLRMSTMMVPSKGMEEPSGPAINLWVSLMLKAPRDMEEPSGMVVVLLCLTILLRGTKGPGGTK